MTTKIDWPKFEYIKPRKNIFRKTKEMTGQSVEDQLLELQDKALTKFPNGKSGIYIFHSKKDDFIYIGSAYDFAKRKLEHLEALRLNRHINWCFQLTYHRHGLDNLSFYIIEICSNEELLTREHKLIYDFDPEINIIGVRWNTLGMDFGSMNEMQDVAIEWEKTPIGREYKRNTIDKKRSKWIETQVGRETVQQDIKNLRERLNSSNKSEEEKVNEVHEYFLEYFPNYPINKDDLVQFVRAGTTFQPLWKRAVKRRTKKKIHSHLEDKKIKTQPLMEKNYNETPKVERPKSKTQIRREQRQMANQIVFWIFAIIAFLIFLLIRKILSF